MSLHVLLRDDLPDVVTVVFLVGILLWLKVIFTAGSTKPQGESNNNDNSFA